VGNGRFALFLPAIEHPLLTGNVQDGKLSNLRKRNLGMGDYRSAVDGIIDELAQKSKQVSIAVADAYKQRTRIANSANTKVLSLLKVEMEKADTLLTKAAKERDRLDLIYEEIDVLFSSKKPKEAYRKAQQLASVSGKANELREYYVAQIKALETIEKSLSSVED
jgi:hypothetical protein